MKKTVLLKKKGIYMHTIKEKDLKTKKMKHSQTDDKFLH